MSLVSRCAKNFSASKTNFTIDHILNVAGKKSNLENFTLSNESSDGKKKFDWLNCTRYRPPKLPRQKKKEGIQRRKMSRNPRIPFSSSQVAFLEAKFLRAPYLSSSDVTQLASYLKLSETRVKIWFQNRRAREKKIRKTKQNQTENEFGKIEVKTLENHQYEESFPANPETSFPISHYNYLNYISYEKAEHFRQMITPLDLSEKSNSCQSVN